MSETTSIGVELQIEWDWRSYSLRDDPLAHLLVTVLPKQRRAAAKNPSDIVLLLDIGRGAEGDRLLGSYGSWIHTLLSRVQEPDRLAIVLYAETSMTLQSLAGPTELLPGDEVLKAIEHLEVAAGRRALLAPALLRAHDELEQGGRSTAVQRIFCLVAHPPHDPKFANRALKFIQRTPKSVTLYGLGATFDASCLDPVVSGISGCSTKHLVDGEQFSAAVGHFLTNSSLVASRITIAASFVPGVVRGGTFQYEPTEMLLPEVGKETEVVAFTSVEQRRYSLLYEVRLPRMSMSGSNSVGTLEVSCVTDQGSQTAKVPLNVERSRGFHRKNGRVSMIRDLLLDFRSNDRAALIRRCRAKLELYRVEKRDPELLQALRKELETLERPDRAPPLTKRDRAYVDSRATTTEDSSPGSAPGSAPNLVSIRWVYPPGQSASPLRSLRTSLGRSHDNDVVLESTEVSRSHAQIQRFADGYVVHDLRSVNGVYCNGKRVEWSPIEIGTVLRLGNWVGIVSAYDPERRTDVREIAPGVYGSTVLADSLREIARIGAQRRNIILCGEPGTGKDVAARAIHTVSGRRGRFVVLNCGRLSDSEIFGQGPLTWPLKRSSKGLVYRSLGGTLYLDDVAELSDATQAKVLHLLQVSGGQADSGGLNVVASTRLGRDALVHALRMDLVLRLDEIWIDLPPLRERREDVFPLFTLFVGEGTNSPPNFTPRFVESLCIHDWPFNVHQLRELAKGLVSTHGSEGVWHRRHLRSVAKWPALEEEPATGASREMARVKAALERAGGNVSLVARELGISRTRLYRLLKRAKD